jgi:NADPH2:quinone reductase
MRAVVLSAAGGTEKLEAVELPIPPLATPTSVRVRLHAAGLNPVDYKMRKSGSFAATGERPILGCDGAGVVEAAGSGVTRFVAGDAVYFCNGGYGLLPGTYAQYAVVEEAYLARKPQSLDFPQAAAVPLALITAWEALRLHVALLPDARVLVHAGAGGVGHIGIQLARMAGAHVIATVSTDEKDRFARGLGAVETIRYRDVDFVEAARAWSGADGVDVVFDTVGGDTFERSVDAVRPYGDLVTCVASEMSSDASKKARNRNERIAYVWMPAPQVFDWPAARRRQTEILVHGARLIDEQAMHVVVGATFPLDRIAEAHALLESGTICGKIVVTIP